MVDLGQSKIECLTYFKLICSVLVYRSLTINKK